VLRRRRGPGAGFRGPLREYTSVLSMLDSFSCFVFCKIVFVFSLYFFFISEEEWGWGPVMRGPAGEGLSVFSMLDSFFSFLFLFFLLLLLLDI
jgi:hypothetical protein